MYVLKCVLHVRNYLHVHVHTRMYMLTCVRSEIHYVLTCVLTYAHIHKIYYSTSIILTCVVQ